MNWSRRMLWWAGTAATAFVAICFFLCKWDWRATIETTWFKLVSPTVSGFAAPYPECQIAQNGISPDCQVAYVLNYSIDPDMSGPPDCLVFRSQPEKRFDLPVIIGNSTTLRDRDGGVVRWAKDSSAVIVFKNNLNFGGGAYEIYVVPIVDGKPGKVTNLESEICKIPHDDFIKDHAKEMNDMAHIPYLIQDGMQTDNLTFNESNQIIVDCVCANDPNDNPNDLVLVKGWSAHVTGLWDPIKGKFFKIEHQVIPLSQ
jgi:hypothetical protein